MAFMKSCTIVCIFVKHNHIWVGLGLGLIAKEKKKGKGKGHMLISYCYFIVYAYFFDYLIGVLE